MPQGEHPNSRANLKPVQSANEARKRGSAGGKASGESRAVIKSMNEDLRERCTPERLAKINDRLLSMAEHGNLRAYEIVRGGLGEDPAVKVRREELKLRKAELDLRRSQSEQKNITDADRQEAAIRVRAALWAQVDEEMNNGSIDR